MKLRPIFILTIPVLSLFHVGLAAGLFRTGATLNEPLYVIAASISTGFAGLLFTLGVGIVVLSR